MEGNPKTQTFFKYGHIQMINDGFLSKKMFINLVTLSCMPNEMGYVPFQNKDKIEHYCDF